MKPILNHLMLLLMILTSLPSLAPAPVHAQAGPAPTADFGDAPDSRLGTLYAYLNVPGKFPTLDPVAGSVVDRSGPFHINARTPYALGRRVSGEESAHTGVDTDGVHNIDPGANGLDQDGGDDGVAAPHDLAHCREAEIQVAVTAFDIGQTFPQQAYVNLWLDFDRSGNWGEQPLCDTGGTTRTANEWAVQNHVVTFTAAATQVITLPTFLAWNLQADEDMWMRVTLSDRPASEADGSGPATGYAFGETEDYRLESLSSPSPVAALPAHTVGDVKPVTQYRLFLPSSLSGSKLGTPGDVAPVPGKIHEADVVHLGGTGNPLPPMVVSVVGSGVAGRLSSWQLGSQAQPPVHLTVSPPQIGYNHRLHVLAPDVNPKVSRRLLLSGRIQNGTLWLTTWRVDNQGNFQSLHTLGYGPNVTPAVAVRHYEFAQRVLAFDNDDQRFQVVTPMLHGNGYLRLITWQIDGLSGLITGRYDSGDIGADAAPDSDLSVVFQAGNDEVAPNYAVSLRTEDDDLTTYFFDVTSLGFPTLRGVAQSGRDIRNGQTINQKARNLVTAPLVSTGFVSAVVNPSGSPLVQSWETLRQLCPGAIENCNYQLSNISDSSRDLDPASPGIQINQPALNTIRALLRDPAYDRDLFSLNPDVLQAIASVRKVMVTVVALDAVEAGQVSLDDVVTVSTAAAAVNGTGASVMGLQAGERISLRNLLYGNMMVSAGDATWAISEHVAGNLDAMVDRMNAKASQLGMSSTVHCQEGTTFSSVSYSTARDQAILWESVYDDPQFLEFAGASSRTVCGTLADNSQLCHPVVPPMTKGMSQYPNLDGHKTGGGGGLCPNDLPIFATVPSCVGGGCLAVQATRLERPLIATELQPSNLTGTRWNDARSLFDYGYRSLFTPDFRADSGGQAGTAQDFALDVVDDGYGVTAAVVLDQSLRICTWAMDTGTGSLSLGRCTNHTYTNLPLGQPQVPVTRLDMVRIGNTQADGDYLLGRLVGNSLFLQLWRVGQRDF